MPYRVLTRVVEPTSLAEQAYVQLRDRLVMLDIAPGAPINESQLSLELGMGRTPIRESLKRLETDHLVVSFPRQGTFASSIDIGDLASISDMRLVLEPHAAERAAHDASDEDRDALRALADEITRMVSAASSNRELIEFDLGVHRAIYRTLGNPYLQETLVRLDNLATRLWWSVLDRLPAVSDHIREHVTLLETIADGRADEAAELAREHVLSFDQSVRAAM